MDNFTITLSNLFFFFFFFSCLIFALFLFLLRQKHYCKCEICSAYLSSSWTRDFPNLCDWLTHLLQKSPTSTIQIHILNSVITSNPSNVQHILKTKFDNYPKGENFSAILGDLLGKGIFNADGDTWRLQRKLASLELGSVSVRHFALGIFRDEIETRLFPLLNSFSGNINGSSVLDLQDVFRRFSFDTISKFSFGFDPACLTAPPLTRSELALAFDAATKLSAERALAPSPLIWKIKRFFNIGSEKKLRDSIRTINRLAKDLIDQRRKFGLIETNDLLSRFMVLIDDDDDYLRDIMVNFLLAGRDTVAATLTAVFWLLARHPDVESRIRVELDRVMGSGTDPVTASFEQMREMHYLHAVLYETMRLYPPVQFDSKFARNDDVLADGTCVRRGTRVTYHPYAMGRMSRVWGSDCGAFDPQRWIDGETCRFRPENPFKYPVFQAGPRACIGKEMALMEIKSVAVVVIRRFDIRVANPGRVMVFAPGLTATVKGGLPVLVRERRSCS